MALPLSALAAPVVAGVIFEEIRRNYGWGGRRAVGPRDVRRLIAGAPMPRSRYSRGRTFRRRKYARIRGRARKPYRRRTRTVGRYQQAKRRGRLPLRQNRLVEGPMRRRRASRFRRRSDLRICAAVRRCMQEKKEKIITLPSTAKTWVLMQHARDALTPYTGWITANPMGRLFLLFEGAYAPTQGDGNDQRTGDQIYVTGLKLQLEIAHDFDNIKLHSNQNQWFTIMILKHTNTTINSPDEVWESPNYPERSQLLKVENRTASMPFQILWKKTFKYNLSHNLGIRQAEPLKSSGWGPDPKPFVKNIKLWIPVREKLQYTTAGTTLRNAHYSFILYQHERSRESSAIDNLLYVNVLEHRMHFKE